MAATLAEGETIIENAAREPEVVDLANMLLKMGAKIEGAGTSTIKVQGVSKLHGVEHEIIADRIEAGTYMIAGSDYGRRNSGDGLRPEHLGALISKMRQAGVDVTEEGATGCGFGPRETSRDGHHHGGVSGIRHGSSGAVHGADDCRPTASPSSPRRSSKIASCTFRSSFAWARISGSKAGRRLWREITI